METNVAFREVQRFRQRLLWGLLAGLALFVALLGPAAVGGLAILGAAAVFVYSIRLRAEVRDDGIYVEMWPIHRSPRRIPWDEIERYESRRYRPIREFGGWGIRWAPGRIAYTVSGDRGVWIERTNGRSVLVGSRRADEFVSAIEAEYEG